MKEKFNVAISLDYFRKIMSLISPTVMVLTILSLFMFVAEDEYTKQSWQYRALTISSVAVLLVVTFTIIHDCFSEFGKRSCLNKMINIIFFIFFFVFIWFVLFYGVMNGANVYSSLFQSSKC